MLTWSDRINPQPMFDILSMARQRENLGEYVARMEIGDTPGFRNHFIHDLVSKHASSPYRYSPSRGEGILIHKVIESQWPSCDEENVVIGPANFLITASLACKTSPGDFVLLPDPGFATYKLSTDFLNLSAIYYPVYANRKPSFPDVEEIIKNLRVRPKVIVINNPSNPLGVAFHGHEISKKLKNFHSLGIEVIFDETYVNLVYDDTQVLSNDIPGTRIRSFSKEHCAPGLRIGYAIAEKESSKTMADLMSLSISCVPQFIQYAVAEYLGSKESINFTNELKNEMGRRLEYLSESLPIGMLQTSPNAAFYALIDTGNRGGDEAFKFMLDRNVSTCPGSKFGDNSKNSVRVSLAGSDKTFEKDVSMLVSALKDWLDVQTN
jgi:aspartate/methionine/tyrosine aminotransferase